MDDVQKGLIQANHDVNLEAQEGFWQKMKDMFCNFYFGVKDSVLKVDSLNSFSMDVYGHVDGCLQDLARSNNAKVFKPEVRPAVTKKVEDKEISGLLDGDANLVDKLTESNKTSEVIAKVLLTDSFRTFGRPERPRQEVVLSRKRGEKGRKVVSSPFLFLLLSEFL